MPATETITQSITTTDGYVVDPETGEVLGHEEVKEQFVPKTPEEVEWCLKKIGKAEADLAAVESNADVVWARAIIANAESLRKEKARKLEWLKSRFEADLAEFARKVLDGQKSRTYKTPVGSISLRIVKGGLRVKDADKALEWAKHCGYNEAIKTVESFQISLLDQSAKDAVIENMRLSANAANDVNQAFELKPDEEKATIKTGVE